MAQRKNQSGSSSRTNGSNRGRSSGSSRGRSSGSNRNSSSGSRNGRSSTRRTRPREEFPDYSIVDPHDLPDGSDVLLDVPVVKVDEIDVELDDLRAQVAVIAEVRDLVQVNVGADVSLGKVELRIEGVEAQALLKARLDNVSLILERVLTSLDRNPELLQSIGEAVEEVGKGTGRLLDDTGDAVEDVGEGTEGAVQDVGQGAGRAAGQVGQGARQGLEGVGRGAGQGVAGVGRGAGQGVAGVGQGARQLTEGLAEGQPGGGGGSTGGRRRSSGQGGG